MYVPEGANILRKNALTFDVCRVIKISKFYKKRAIFVLCYENIFWFQITMTVSYAMQVLQSIKYLRKYVESNLATRSTSSV
jgi:hypothetical protein